MRLRRLQLVAGVFALAAAAGPLPARADCSAEFKFWKGAEKEVYDLATQDQSLSKQIGPAEAAIVEGNIFGHPASAATVQQFCLDLGRDVALLERAFLVFTKEFFPACQAVAKDATCTQAQRDEASNACVVGLFYPLAAFGTKQKATQMAALYSAAKCSTMPSP
jgi:hypothetical protein